MNSKKPSKPFAFGFVHGSASKPKSLLDPEEQTHKKPTTLDYFSEEDSQPKKRKLIKLEDDLDEGFDKQDKLSNVNEDYVGDLEDDRPPPPRTSTGIQGFVPQGFSFNKGFTNVHEVTSDTKLDDVQKDDEIDDPLDAFMLDIDNQVQKESQNKSLQEKIRRDDIEDEDFVESYVNHMKKKGIEVGKSQRPIEKDENVNSDEEVYATARAIDAQLEYDSDDNPIVEQKRKDIEPLPAVDHSQIEYPEIEKFFYEEHLDIAGLSDERVKEIRRELDMHVSGADVAKPCISFAHFGFDEALLNVIIKHGYSEPTGIQKQAVPVAMSGRDIIGIAKTGSGKTAAFIWPMLIHIMDQEELQKGEGPIGLILAPTRELASQIYTEAKKFAKSYGLRNGIKNDAHTTLSAPSQILALPKCRVAAVYGGASKMDQFKELRPGGIEILVGTPGRLIDMVKMKATNFRRVSFLVLDEADRMFDLGFEPQVRSICDNIRPDRQTLLFSATFPKKVEILAREVTTEPVRISIGSVGQANTDITQRIEILADDGYKWDWLMNHLVSFCVEGSVLIFVSRKDGVEALSNNLKQVNYECRFKFLFSKYLYFDDNHIFKTCTGGALHGDMMQADRDKVLKDFKNNKFPIMVATDVAARGLDIKAVKTVVNYDIARDIDSHVHRIGRTGRAGEKGTAYTLITQKEDKFAGDLVRNLEASGQQVPDALMNLAMQNSRFRKSRNMIRRGRGRSGGRGRGYGRGRGRGTNISNSNSIPLGGRAGIGSAGVQIPPPPQLNTDTSGHAGGKHPMNFQKASTADAELGLLRSSKSSTSSQSGNQKKRRWDS
ncbi:2814_t:CDS:10 [Dentiscutata erythropus]|uniref:RNA helicase n=1 Tax=Dentiscutata erythropus TaxID=1348616 RepID=A0A9N8YZP0_9GLOM|nr:2814_t:CDS:10 [Dentiscutata erythropus]